jgi:8-oxo-dGTP pyrophosphatase MutT (NUDIX family)/DNA-binding XRE family transcriptional regulator
MSKQTIGPRIKAFRKGRGITQAELAKSLGYSHKSVITHIEKGESEMSYEKILLLLKTYAADANELFDVQHIDKLLEEHDKFKKEEARRNAWMKDILFDVDGVLFSYRVGGVLVKDNKILLTKVGDDYSLPGGHSQVGETSQQTIIREFKEKTGFDVAPLNVISTYENFWKWGDKDCHQLCIYYKLNMVDETQELVLNPDTKGTEYVWFELEKLKTINLFPNGISNQILNKVSDNTHFIFSKGLVEKIKQGEKEDISKMSTYNPNEEW